MKKIEIAAPYSYTILKLLMGIYIFLSAFQPPSVTKILYRPNQRENIDTRPIFSQSEQIALNSNVHRGKPEVPILYFWRFIENRCRWWIRSHLNIIERFTAIKMKKKADRKLMLFFIHFFFFLNLMIWQWKCIKNYNN